MRLNYTHSVLVFLILVASASICTAQDLIAMKNGEKMKVDIISVGDKEVEFQQLGADTGSTYIINKSDIFSIQFRDGVIDTIGSRAVVKEPAADSTRNWYFKGIEDADAYYKGKRSARGAIFASALIATPVLAIYPALACATSPPADKNLNIRNNALLQNSEYMDGYRDEAFDIKRRKVLKSYVVATIIWVAVVGFMVY